MPIFTQTLQKIDPANPQEAIKKMVQHIKYLQEQLEYTLVNLDSGNIVEIDINETNIAGSDGETNIGSYIHLPGPNGESFTAGTKDGKFEFTVRNQSGDRVMYLNGYNFIITDKASLTIDGGVY